MSSNPVFCIDVVDTEAIIKTAPEAKRKALKKKIRGTQNFYGCDFSIIPESYNINIADLHHTVEFCLKEYNQRTKQ